MVLSRAMTTGHWEKCSAAIPGHFALLQQAKDMANKCPQPNCGFLLYSRKQESTQTTRVQCQAFSKPHACTLQCHVNNIIVGPHSFKSKGGTKRNMTDPKIVTVEQQRIIDDIPKMAINKCLILTPGINNLAVYIGVHGFNSVDSTVYCCA